MEQTKFDERASESAASDPPAHQRIQSSSVLRNSALLFGFHVVTKSLAFVSFILLARYLGAEMFGIYNYAFALTALFIPLCDLGMDTYLMREVPRLSAGDIPKKLGAVLAWKGLLTFLVFLGISLTTGILDSFGSERFFVVVLAGLITLLRTYWTTFASFFRAIDRVGIETGMLSGARIAEFIVIVLSMWLDTGLLSLLSVMTLVNILFVTGTHFLVRSRFTQPILVGDFAHMISIFRGGLPFAMATIFSAVYFNFDTVLLSKYVGDSAAGIYRAAYNLIFPLTMFGLAVSGAVFPFASQNYRSHPDEVKAVIRRSITQLVMISLPIAVITTALSAEIVQFLFDPEFSEAAQCLAILAWFLPLVFLSTLYSNTLGAIDDQIFVLKATLAIAVFNVLANAFVIPRFAQIGAATVTVVTALLGFVLLLIRVRQKFQLHIAGSLLLRIALAAAVPVPFLVFKPELHVIILLSISVGLYGAALLALRALRFGDVVKLVNSVRSPQNF